MSVTQILRDIRSTHEVVMFLFTVHARELLNLPGHGLGLDVSRKSRIRPGGFFCTEDMEIYGVLFRKEKRSLTCCRLQQSI